MNDAPLSGQEPANLRLLRILVSVLAATMIAGFLVIVAVIVIRFSGPRAPALPDTITLPQGTRATAFTRGPDWYAIVTADQHILIYDQSSGALRQDIVISPGR